MGYNQVVVVEVLLELRTKAFATEFIVGYILDTASKINKKFTLPSIH